MRAPLAPHAEQDGWRYVRVRDWRSLISPRRNPKYVFSFAQRVRGKGKCGEFTNFVSQYDDSFDGSRIISSRRVEEAVETADYLKRCAEAELNATYFNSYPNGRGKWCVFSASLDKWRVGDDHVWGDTLREAYWRYKNAVTK